MPLIPEPGLYGLKNTNRKGKDLWGKNQFNSTFPVSLACWMRDNSINPVYIRTSSIDGKLTTKADPETLTWNEVFNTDKPNDELTFNFESVFKPYLPYVHDDIDPLDHIDLVVKLGETFLRPLEVKLTVLPDDNSSKLKDESLWGSELVVRPASTSYAALGMFHSIPKDRLKEARNLIEPVARWSEIGR